jgi:hypothetical protein
MALTYSRIMEIVKGGFYSVGAGTRAFQVIGNVDHASIKYHSVMDYPKVDVIVFNTNPMIELSKGSLHFVYMDENHIYLTIRFYDTYNKNYVSCSFTSFENIYKNQD